MNIGVVLLDGGNFEVQNLKKDTLGKEIFKNACNKVGLTDETDYFGLRFINKKDGEYQWIDNDRTVKSQLAKEANENITHYLHFAVKFFPVNPTNIKHDLTRYQFVLQLRESLLNGRLECSMPIYALLGSFIVQAEFGDYHSGEHSSNYLDDFKFCPDQPPDLIEKIHDYHKRHKENLDFCIRTMDFSINGSFGGMTPERAELNFLDNVRKLPMYGVHRHLALDVNSEKVYIGVSNIGITVYRGNRLMSKFIWPKILSIDFKSKRLYVKIKPADEDDDFYKTSVGFKLSNRVAAKRLWKQCVEHHTFFRLENVGLAEKKGLRSRFGSPFRYTGKTQNEIVKEQPEPGPEEPFSRVSSKRFSERVLKGNRKEPKETKSETKSEVPTTPPKDGKDGSPLIPVIEVEEVAEASRVDDVETTPEVKGPENVPEIKVVEASPELKVKSKERSAEEAEGGEDEKKVKEVEEAEVPEDGENDNNENEEVVQEPAEDKEDAPGSDEDTQLVISNPLAEGDVKSFASHSVTTTTYTTQSSTDDADPASFSTSSSTAVSSTQVITTSETKQEVVTTSSTTKTLLEKSTEGTSPDDS